MAKFVNEISWSKSRWDIFKECLRKYYYHYYGSWGGWEKDAPELTSQLYVLKQLKTRKMWAGEVVHNCLERVLADLVKSIKPLSNEEILDLTLKLMRSDFRNSRDKHYWHNPKSCALFEHEYNIPVSDEKWQQLAEQVKLSLNNFLNSRTYKTILTLPSQDIKEVEQFSSFNLDGTKIIVKLDFCCSINGQLYIYDWKTGQKTPDSDLQLVCYALYAQERWQVDFTDCKLLEYNLLKDRLSHFFVSENILEDARRQILNSIQQMKELLFDKRHNIAKEEDFAKTERLAACRYCNFVRVCRPEIIT